MDIETKIIQASIRLFSRQGFAGTTTKQIAAQAKVNEGTIYRHFKTKENLIEAVLNRKLGSGGFTSPNNTFIDITRDNFRQRLIEFASSYLRSQVLDPDYVRLILYAGLEGSKKSFTIKNRYHGPLFEQLDTNMAQWVKSGLVQTKEARIIIRAMVAPLVYNIIMCCVFGYWPIPEKEIPHMAEVLTDHWLRGLGFSSLPNAGSPATAGHPASS